MRVRRGFTYLGCARKFRVYVNSIEKVHLHVFKEKEVYIEEVPCVVQIETMKFEKSKAYRIDQRDVHLKVNVHPMVRITYASFFLMMIGLLYFYRIFGLAAPIISLGLAGLILVLQFKVFAKNYITVKATDGLGQKIELTEMIRKQHN